MVNFQRLHSVGAKQKIRRREKNSRHPERKNSRDFEGKKFRHRERKNSVTASAKIPSLRAQRGSPWPRIRSRGWPRCARHDGAFEGRPTLAMTAPGLTRCARLDERLGFTPISTFQREKFKTQTKTAAFGSCF